MTRPAKRQKVERRAAEWEAADALLWDPHALVGKELRCLWPAENRYFPGRVTKYTAETLQHEIQYEDGDEETLVLAIEKIQLTPACARAIVPPSPAHLLALARHLDELADKLEVKAVQQRTARGRAMLREEDRQQLEMLRRRAAEARVAHERREQMLRQEHQQRSHHARSEGALSAGRSAATTGRVQRAAAVSAAAAIAATSQGRVAGLASPQRGGQEVTSPRAALGSPQPGHVQPAQGQDRPSGSDGAPFRVCSPGSAKRRQQLLRQQQEQGLVQGQSAGAGAASGAGASQALGQSPFGYPLSSGAPSQRPSSQAPHSVSAPWRAVATGWGAGPRVGRGQGASADGDLGRLYVPRPWPTVRIATATPAAADVEAGPLAAGKVTAEVGPKKQQHDGSAARIGEDLGGGMDGGAGTHAGSGVGDEEVKRDATALPAAEEKRRSAVMAAELRDAYQHFRRHCAGFKQYHELQVVLWLSGQQLVGREVRVLWPDEEAWFCGRVTRYDEEAGTHTVEYDDGDVEHLHLAAEEVRLQVVPGEAEAALLPQPPEALKRAAACLAADAARLRERAQELQRLQAKQQRSRASVSGQEQEEDPAELLAKADRWSTRAAQLQALVAIMLRGSECSTAAHVAERKHQEQQQQQATVQGTEPEANAAQGRRMADVAAAAGPESCDVAAAEGGSVVPAPLTPPVEPATDAPSDVCGGEAEAVPAARPRPLDEANGDADSVMADVAEADTASALEPAAAIGMAAPPPEPPLPADWDTAQVLRPGEVVWAQVRRSAPWPAIIITREEAEREGLSAARMGASASSSMQLVCVRFFGDHTVYALPAVSAGQRIPERGGALPFLAGLELGWHFRRGAAAAAAPAANGNSGHSQRFQRAIFELRTYMTEGELPRGMIPPNYDEDDDEEMEDSGADAAVGTGPVGKAGGKRGAAGTSAAPSSLAAAGDVTFPFIVSPKLQVLKLGEVVWLSRWFHDEKYIYPVGYTAVRLMASGASGGREVRHVMEVAASEDGVRPVFRITPEGRPSVSADTATRAMRALFEDDVLARGRAFAKTGADLFGLSNPRVAALVRTLPGTDRCERFANWPDQDKPPLPLLTAHEELQRRALYARSLRLPPGVVAVPHTKAGMCFECEVCGEDEESPDDLKLECDMCRCVVHSRCYGVKQPPHGSLWLCDVCQLHAAGLPADRAPPCELCPVAGGPMKRTEGGGYVHVLCAVWTPGVALGDPDTLEPVGGIAKAVQNRSSLRCFLCKQPYGACIQCAGGARCYTAFHPMCAREAGLAMCEVRQAAKQRRAGTNGRPAAAAAGAGAAAAEPSGPALRRDAAQSGAASCAVELDVQPAIADEVPKAGTCGGVAEPMRVDEGKENRPKNVSSGDLVALAAEGGGDAVVVVKTAAATSLPPTTARDDGKAVECGDGGPGDTPAAPHRRGRGRPRGGASSRHAAMMAALDRRACSGGVSLGNGMSLLCFCPRHEDLVLHAMHYRTSYPGGRFAERRAELVREQLRERRQQLLAESERSQPDGADTAAAPRSGAAANVGGGQAAAAAGAGSARAASFADWRSRGHRAPEAVAIAREKRTFVRQLPYLVTGRLQQDERTMRAVPCSSTRPGDGTSLGAMANGSSAGPSSAAAAAPDDRAAEAADVDSWLPAPLLEAAAAGGARSVAERYTAMRATVGRRLAAGKSAIHGWGAFAKVPHKRGDMMIEYAGELIRPIVSDVREKRMYDKLVGSGTYIFNLNDQQHIDATRAGNMAHLLNHSCDPNCYSRTITLWSPDTGSSTDHVIITAKRDIEAWEELTYDYRFNSNVELPCNCGAAKCRLLVNWPEQARDDEEDDEAEEAEDGDGMAAGAAVDEGRQ